MPRRRVPAVSALGKVECDPSHEPPEPAVTFAHPTHDGGMFSSFGQTSSGRGITRRTRCRCPARTDTSRAARRQANAEPWGRWRLHVAVANDEGLDEQLGLERVAENGVLDPDAVGRGEGHMDVGGERRRRSPDVHRHRNAARGGGLARPTRLADPTDDRRVGLCQVEGPGAQPLLELHRRGDALSARDGRRRRTPQLGVGLRDRRAAASPRPTPG